MARTLRTHYGWTTACVLAALLAIGWHALASAGNGRGAKDAIPVDDLADLMRNPGAFTGRSEIAFYCRFALVGKLFKEINTRYNSDAFVNFSVWPHQARLWEDEGRRQLLPTLYVDKREAAHLDQIRQAAKYDLLLVHGKVTGTYGNMPWITVTRIERLPVPEERLSETLLMRIRRGCELLDDNPRAAASLFQEALAMGVPAVHRAFVNERLARCWRNAGMPLRTLDPLRNVVGELANDPNAHLALAEAELAAGNIAASIEAAKKALEHTPRYAPAQSLLAEAYGRQGLYAQGLEMLKLAGEDPNLHPRDRAMLDVRRARVFVLARRYADAVESYARAISEGSPLSGEPWVRREIAALYEDRFDATQKPELLDDAIREYKNANALAPRGDAAALCRAAEAEYNRALRLSPGNPDYAPVYELLRQADEIAPAYPPARALAARLLHVKGNAQRAEAIFSDLLAECANDPTGLMAVADAYDAIGRGDIACDLYGRVLDMEPWNRRAADRRARIEACGAPARTQPGAGALAEAGPASGAARPPVAAFSSAALAAAVPAPVEVPDTGGAFSLEGLGIALMPAPAGRTAAGAPAMGLSMADAGAAVSGPGHTLPAAPPVVSTASIALPGAAPASTWTMPE